MLSALQGGKGGGKQKQKQSAIPQAGTAVVPWRRPEVVMHNLLLVESFSRIVGRSERRPRPHALPGTAYRLHDDYMLCKTGCKR